MTVDCTLANNFKEIYHAAAFPAATPSLPLVSNFSSTRLYDSRYCWGRLWRWFYEAVYYMTGISWQQTKLHQALIHTQNLFHQEIAKTQASLKEYIAYLEENGKGYPVAEDSVFQARHTITNWNAATKPFFKIIQKGPVEKQLQELAKDSLPTPLFTCSDAPLFHAYQKIIDTEGYLASPLPLALIKKIIRKKWLHAIDQKEIKKWTRKINTSSIDLNTLHKALETLHTCYTKSGNPSRSFLTLGELELFLEDQGCHSFQKKDPKHLQWRQDLQPGMPLPFNLKTAIQDDKVMQDYDLDSLTKGDHSQKIKAPPAVNSDASKDCLNLPSSTAVSKFSDQNLSLGSELSSHTFDDNIRTYTIQETPDLIALVAHNRVALQLHDLRIKQQPDIGLAAVRLKAISSDGKMALAERLKELTSHQWSTPNDLLTPKDLTLLEPLAHLVQRCIQQNITPIPFSCATFMIDKEGQLKTIKPIKIGPFNFNALEDLIAECAAGNAAVYQELMDKSGLDQHQTAKFYRDLTKQIVQGSDITPEELAAIYKITDPQVVDRAALLIKQLKSGRKDAF